jgi:hypothetical protein
MEPNNHYDNLLQLLGISLQVRECLGYAKTQGRKCRCQISVDSQTRASQILFDFTATVKTLEDAKHKLALVASLLLCKRFHQDQNISISNPWVDKIREYAIIIDEPVPSPSLGNQRRPTRARRQRRSLRPQPVEAEQPPEQRSDSATPSQAVSNRRILRSDTRNTRSSHQKCGICWDGYDDAEDGEILKCLLCENILHKECGMTWMRQSTICPYW